MTRKGLNSKAPVNALPDFAQRAARYGRDFTHLIAVT
jgi:hypothetical protein